MSATGSRRFLQMRLATVLVLTALTAIALAIWFQLVTPYQRQLSARIALLSAADTIKDEPSRHGWLAAVMGPEIVNDVVLMHCKDKETEPASLHRFGELPFLRDLILDDVELADDTASQLAKLTRLEHLSLRDNPVSDYGFASIARCRRLRTLDLKGTRVSDDGLEAIRDLPSLSELRLPDAVAGPGLDIIAKLPSLTELNLSATSVPPEELIRLAGSPLKKLTPPTVKLPSSVCDLMPMLPNLEEITGGMIVAANDADAKEISRCKHLHTLDLVGSRLSDVAVEHLSQVTTLRSLTLHGDFTDRSLDAIRRALPNLTRLNIAGRFSQTSIARFQESRPNVKCEIETTTLSTDSNRSSALLRVVARNRNKEVYKELIVRWPAKISDFLESDASSGLISEIESIRCWDVPQSYLYDFDDAPMWNLAGIEQFLNLKGLYARRVDRDVFSKFRKFPHLTTLALEDPTIDDDAIAGLAIPEECQKLWLMHSLVSPKAMANFESQHPYLSIGYRCSRPAYATSTEPIVGVECFWRRPTQAMVDNAATYQELRSIELSHLTSLDLSPLADLTELERLKVTNPRGLSSGMISLSRDLPAVKQFTSNAFYNGNDWSLLLRMPNLETLIFEDQHILKNAFKTIGRLKSLRHLKLQSHRSRGPWIAGEHLSELAGSPLEVLDLYGNPIQDQYLPALGGIKRLKKLTLDKSSVSDPGCVHLAATGSLRSLSLASTSLTDAGILHLATHPSLEELCVSSTAITGLGLASLQKMPRLRKLDVTNCDALTMEQIRNFEFQRPNVEIFHNVSS